MQKPYRHNHSSFMTKFNFQVLSLVGSDGKYFALKIILRPFVVRYDAQKATRNKRNSGETFFIEILTQIAQLRQVDEDGVAPAIFSPAIYSDSFEYKVGIRLHPNGVDEEEGRYVALFVHMMMGEYDNASEVRWPFTQRITVSILDQSDAKRHISHIIQPKPHLAAFQKPTEAVTPTGYGFIRFAPIEEAFSFPYVENDKMFIKIQFSA